MPDYTHLIMILALAGLAWDVLRRFAGKASSEDLDELHAWIEGMGEEASKYRRDLDVRLDMLTERVVKHGETLTKLGLAGRSKP